MKKLVYKSVGESNGTARTLDENANPEQLEIIFLETDLHKGAGVGIPDRILREKQVLEITGLSRSGLWELLKSGDFPARVRLGPEGSRAIGWRLSKVLEWIQARPEVSDEVPVPSDN